MTKPMPRTEREALIAIALLVIFFVVDHVRLSVTASPKVPEHRYEVFCPQEKEHDARDPNCRGLDYGPSDCAGCTKPIHGGPDYCIACGFARGGRR